MSHDDLDLAVEDFLPRIGEHKLHEDAANLAAGAGALIIRAVTEGTLDVQDGELLWRVIETQSHMIHAAEHVVDYLRANPMGHRIAPN